jgi:hypothetical protein
MVLNFYEPKIIISLFFLTKIYLIDILISYESYLIRPQKRLTTPALTKPIGSKWHSIEGDTFVPLKQVCRGFSSSGLDQQKYDEDSSE